LTELIATPSRTSAVTVETVTTVLGVQALRTCYEQLQRATRNALPFATYDWHLAWCNRVLNSNPRIHDQPYFLVVRNYVGECISILPFIVSRRRVGPIRVSAVSLLGADPNITEIRAPVMVSGYEHLIARAVQQRLAKIDGWDWVHWTGISDAFGEALSANCTLYWQQPAQPDFILDLAPTWEQFRSGLKRNIRESLRHCYNSLKRDKHAFEFRVIESGPEVAAGIERFFELHGMRANMTGGVPHPNRFMKLTFRDFLHEVCQRFADSGNLRIFQIVIGSVVVATRIGFVTGDSIYFYYSGYDPAWARYSIMTTTVAEAIKYAIGQGFKTINLSPNKEVSKTRWGPRQVDYKSAYQQGSRLRSRIARQAYVRARSGDGLQGWVLQHLVPARRNWR
jgi:CelD/BcsL family acetyltransferase involved in cellulose biosynthesis